MADESSPPAAPAQTEMTVEVKPPAKADAVKGPLIGPRGPHSSYTDSHAE